MVEDSEL